MKFENSKISNGTPRFYCEGCKRNCLTDNIFVEYRSLIKDLKRKRPYIYEDYGNKNPAIHYLESSDDDSEDSDEEMKILLKERQTEINIKSSENTDDKELEIEVLKSENNRLNKEIGVADPLKQAIIIAIQDPNNSAQPKTMS